MDGRVSRWAASLATCALHVSCARMSVASCARPAAPVARPDLTEAAPTCTAADERKIGEPRTIDNIVVYPITSCSQVDVGPIVTLDEALAKGTAKIHEV